MNIATWINQLGFDLELCGRLCLVLVHSLWQIALLTALATLIASTWKNATPERIYALYTVALLLGLVALPVTFLLTRLPGETVALCDVNTTTRQQISPAPNAPLEPRMKVQQAAPPLEVSTPPALPTAAQMPPHTTATNLLSWSPWIVGCYVVGVVVMLLRLLRGLWQNYRLSAQATPLAAGPLVDSLQRLERTWSLRAVPALAFTERVIVPQVVGLWRPVILLPTAAIAGLRPDELEMILAHEIAHVRRYDLWMNLVQRLAEAVLFFNPAVWYLSRQISSYREYCCDEATCRLARQTADDTRLRYAEALLRAVELTQGAAQGQKLAALAASGNRPSELRRRVARLFGEPLREPMRLSRSGLVTMLVGVAILLAIPLTRQNAAETESKATSKTETTKPAVKVVAIGTHDEEPQQWWDAEGKLLEDVPFTWTAKARVTAPDSKWRRIVFRVMNLPPDADLTWDLTSAGASGSGEIDFVENPAEGKFFTEFFGLNENQKTFGLRVGIASGPWETISEADTQVAVGLPGGKGIVFSQALSTSEGTVVVVSQTNINQHSRVVAIDKRGELHTAKSRGGGAAGGMTQTSPTFPNLKPEDIDHFEFQTRDYEWTEIKDLPVKVGEKQASEAIENLRLPPITDADRAVAASRKKTFGLHEEPRVLFLQTFRQAEINTIQGVEDGSLAALWQARSKTVEDAQLDLIRHKVTLAWDANQLLIKTDAPPLPGDSFMQSRFWDGKEGWLGEVANGNRHVYRYNDLDKLTEHVMPFYFPQWVAAGGRLPWNGPTVVLMENEVAPTNTRYRLIGEDTIDGLTCDVYEGPERQETIWIDQTDDLIKAVSRHYVFDSTQAENWQAIQSAADREFADHEAYMKWHKSLEPAEQLRFSARWAAATWPRATPGNLAVFSDYREISPGVQWPMKVERIHVRSEDRDGKKAHYFTRLEIAVSEVKTDFAIRQLATDALPSENVEVTDRRGEVPIDYTWTIEVTEQEIARLQEKQLAERRAKEEEERQINEAPIESVTAAIEILTDGPNTDPTKIWARAIKYLVDHKDDALPEVIAQLDKEERDHPISKLAFALRALGDPRGVPAFIRALPKTLLPSRSDYSLLLKDETLCKFMQEHSISGKVRPGFDQFEYGRAFREVTSALHKLTGQDLGEMELNWVHLAETEAQRVQQRKLYHRIAQRWANWWEENWSTYTQDAKYAEVNLAETAESGTKFAGRRVPPAGEGVQLEEGHSGWIVQSIHESQKRCFIDLDTGREMGWPSSLPAFGKIGLDSPEFLAWARSEGIDMVGISHVPEGEEEPLYCLQPIDMHVWKISEEEHRKLAKSMAGESPYPLSEPVKLMVPQREVPRPYDYEFSGDSFLFVTREGTAGVVRMTAQVTEAKDITGYVYSRDDMFSPVGFYRGGKVNFAAMSEPSE